MRTGMVLAFVMLAGAAAWGQNAVQPGLRVARPPAVVAAKPFLYEKVDATTLTKEQRAAVDKARAATDGKIAALLAEEQATIQKLLTDKQRSAMGEIDSMKEVGEMTSMRLQMVMDRRAKFVEALSNLMKKEGETASSIIQNMK